MPFSANAPSAAPGAAIASSRCKLGIVRVGIGRHRGQSVQRAAQDHTTRREDPPVWANNTSGNAALAARAPAPSRKRRRPVLWVNADASLSPLKFRAHQKQRHGLGRELRRDAAPSASRGVHRPRDSMPPDRPGPTPAFIPGRHPRCPQHAVHERVRSIPALRGVRPARRRARACTGAGPADRSCARLLRAGRARHSTTARSRRRNPPAS